MHASAQSVGSEGVGGGWRRWSGEGKYRGRVRRSSRTVARVMQPRACRGSAEEAGRELARSWRRPKQTLSLCTQLRGARARRGCVGRGGARRRRRRRWRRSVGRLGCCELRARGRLGRAAMLGARGGAGGGRREGLSHGVGASTLAAAAAVSDGGRRDADAPPVGRASQPG
jgi:hypothetical protein